MSLISKNKYLKNKLLHQRHCLDHSKMPTEMSQKTHLTGESLSVTSSYWRN